MADASERPAPGRRDPEGRRRAIILAAAEIIVEHGTPALTHRAVAKRAGVAVGSTTAYFASLDDLRASALTLLAEENERALAEVEAAILPLEQAPERCAAIVYEYLIDPRQVHAGVALMNAGVNDPDRRGVALHWADGLTTLLTRHVGHECALAIGAYVDGLTVHAALHDEPVAPEVIARTIRALLTLSSGATSATNSSEQQGL